MAKKTSATQIVRDQVIVQYPERYSMMQALSGAKRALTMEFRDTPAVFTDLWAENGDLHLCADGPVLKRALAAIAKELK
jgi:hypothetical protein